MINNTQYPEAGYETGGIPVKSGRKEKFFMKKRSPMLIVRISLDILMLALLLLLYQKRTVSMSFHEVAGLVLFGLFLIHNLLNWKWIKGVTLKLFKKTTSFHLRIGWIINISLFITMTGIIITGLMISKTLPFHLGNWFRAKQWHYFLAAISIVLMGIHLGLHWSFIRNITSRISFFPKKLSLAIGVLLLAAALGWGGYSLFTGSFARWVTGPFTNVSFQKPEGMGAYGGEGRNNGESAPPDGDTELEKPPQEGGQGKGKNSGGRGDGGMMPGGGHNMSQGISVTNILTVIATYSSEMTVFAFLTVLILGRRKEQRSLAPEQG